MSKRYPWAGKTDPLSTTQWALEQANHRLVSQGALLDQYRLTVELMAKDMQGGPNLIMAYRREAAEIIRKNPPKPYPYSYIGQGYSNIPAEFFNPPMTIEEIPMDNESAYRDGTDTMAGSWKPGPKPSGNKAAAIAVIGAVVVIGWLLWLAS